MTWLEKHITLHEYDSEKDEKLNGLTHLIGAVLSLIGLIWLCIRSEGRMLAPCIVYGITMTVLYASSSLYHYLPKGDAKRFCRILDHSNIYFLIAGTYTPIMVYLDSGISKGILIAVWAIAILGIAFTLIFWGRLRPLHVILYIAMGWLVIFFYKDTIALLDPRFFHWVLAGGLAYTFGVIFYAVKKIPHYHAIWHVFCLLGSFFFFMGISIYLL